MGNFKIVAMALSIPVTNTKRAEHVKKKGGGKEKKKRKSDSARHWNSLPIYYLERYWTKIKILA